MSGYKTSGRGFNLIVRKLGYLNKSHDHFEVRYICKSENRQGTACIDVRLRPGATPVQFYEFVSACKACGLVRAQGAEAVIFGQTAQAVNSLRDNQPWHLDPDPPRYADAYGYERVFAPLAIF
jgi:hypothetical protein